jgi:hypothetical protein
LKAHIIPSHVSQFCPSVSPAQHILVSCAKDCKVIFWRWQMGGLDSDKPATFKPIAETEYVIITSDINCIRAAGLWIRAPWSAMRRLVRVAANASAMSRAIALAKVRQPCINHVITLSRWMPVRHWEDQLDCRGVHHGPGRVPPGVPPPWCARCRGHLLQPSCRPSFLVCAVVFRFECDSALFAGNVPTGRPLSARYRQPRLACRCQSSPSSQPVRTH